MNVAQKVWKVCQWYMEEKCVFANIYIEKFAKRFLYDNDINNSNTGLYHLV